jgi:hypothetical protein
MTMARDEIHVWVPLDGLQRTHDHEIVDAALASSVAARGPTGPVRKEKVASFYGHDFNAERDEAGDLHIYRVSSGVGLPVDLVGGSAGDSAKGPMTALRMQQISEASRRRVAGGR